MLTARSIRWASPRTSLCSNHSLSATYQPTIEVTLGNKVVEKFQLTLTATLRIQGFILRIEEQKITAIESGSCSGRSRSIRGKVNVVDRPIVTFDLPGTLPLGEGIPIAS
jgi:hypothetical protein